MTESIFMIAFSAFLVQNIVLSQFLGLCSFFGVSNKEKTAVGMGLSVLFVITISSSATWLVYEFILVPFHLEYLQTLVFILLIASLVQVVEMFIKKVSKSLYQALGIYLPLITTNCAVLGTALSVTSNDFTFIQMLVFAIFTSGGYTFIIYVFSFIRELILKNPVPRTMRGMPVALFTACVMAMVMMGFL